MNDKSQQKGREVVLNLNKKRFNVLVLYCIITAMFLGYWKHKLDSHKKQMAKEKRINNDMQIITRTIKDQATQNMYDNSIITLDEYIRLMSTTMNSILKKDSYQHDGCHFRHHSVTEIIYLQFLLSHGFSENRFSFCGIYQHLVEK